MAHFRSNWDSNGSIKTYKKLILHSRSPLRPAYYSGLKISKSYIPLLHSHPAHLLFPDVLVHTRAPIGFTLHLLTAILMDGGWVTRSNFWQGYSVPDASQHRQRWRSEPLSAMGTLFPLCKGMYVLTLLTKLLLWWKGKYECLCNGERCSLWCESVQHVLHSDVKSAELTC